METTSQSSTLTNNDLITATFDEPIVCHEKLHVELRSLDKAVTAKYSAAGESLGWQQTRAGPIKNSFFYVLF